MERKRGDGGRVKIENPYSEEEKERESEGERKIERGRETNRPTDRTRRTIFYWVSYVESDILISPISYDYNYLIPNREDN